MSISGPAVINEAAGTATYTVTLSAASAAAISVTYATADGVAVSTGSAADFTAASGTLTFAPGGALTQTFTVAITNDVVFEGSEAFNVNLTGASNATISSTAGSVISAIVDDGRSLGSGILANDDRPTVASVSSPSAVEGNNVVFTVTLSNASTSATSVTVNPASGTGTGIVGAILGTDTGAQQVSTDGGATWSALGATVNVPAGSTSFQVRMPAIADGIAEGSETFTLAAQTANQVSAVIGTATITDAALPTVSISGPAVINEAAGTATYTVTLSAASAAAIGVNYATADGVAVGTGSAADFTATSGILTFAAGELTKTFTVAITNDTVFEGSEAFSVSLTGATNATISTTAGSVTSAIKDDGTGTGGTDDDLPTVSIAVNPTSMGEDATGVLTYTVTLSNASAFATTVNYTLAGTATSGTDYSTTATGTMTIAAGSLTGTFRVEPTPDTVYEGNETVIASITSATTNSVAMTATTASATGIINDDSDRPTIISVGDVGGFTSNVTVDEGVAAVFRVTMSNASAIATSFTLALTNGSGTNAALLTNDYLAINGAATLAYTDAMKFSNGVTLSGDGNNIIVPAGVASFTVTVQTVNDAVIEQPETFNLSVGGTTGIGTIIDNDGPPTVAHIGDPTGSTNNVMVAEGVAAVFTVNLSHPSLSTTSFALALVDGTANLASDYTNAMTFSDGVRFSSGTITVPIGVMSFTVTVPTVENTVYEPTENFTLQIGTATGIGIITDNDTAPTISHVGNGTINNVTVVEGVPAVFTVNLSNASSATSSFALALSNGSALLGEDYTGGITMTFSNGVTYNISNGFVTVPAGVTSFTVTVPTIEDTIYELTQTFVLSVGGVAGTGYITDNDTVTSTPQSNSVPGGQNTLEDTPLVFNAGNNNAITVTGGGTLTTTLSVGSGTLTAEAFTGATITTNASGSVTITGTAAAITGALNGLSYAGVADYNGSVILTVATSDGISVTSGGIAINLTQVADIANDTATFTPTSTDFCDTVPTVGTNLATTHDTYTVANASTDTVIYGLGGNDTITTTSLTTSSNSIVTLGGNDIITTTTVDGKNVICAGDGDNTITTTVTGIGGNFVEMGSGNDTMTTTNVNGNNLILGGDGNNTITTTTTGTGTTKVVTGDGNDTITTTNVGFGTSTVLSGAGNDTITTGAGADLVVSGAGNDTITTTGGNDIVFAGAGNDTVTTGEGNDIVLGGGGDDIIAAGAGDDIVFGGDGDDKINAATGADIIDSGKGDDIIRLGSDANIDTVIFGANAAANGSDVITQFTSGTDKLNLAAMTTQTATTAVTGNLTVTAGSVYFLNMTAGAASSLAAAATALQGGATSWTNASLGVVAFFVVTDASSSAIYQYVEAGGTGITAGELTLMGTVDTPIATTDLVFVANAAAAAGLAAAMDALAATADASSVSSVTIDVLANDTFENISGSMMRAITAINGSAITDGGTSLAVANGSVALLAGKLVFTPTSADYNGVASFTYTVTSGGVNETAYVNVAVGIVPVGVSPVNNVPSGQYAEAGTAVVFSTANTNAIKVADSDSLGLTTTLSVGSGGTLTAVTAGGAALITGNGSGSLSIAGTADEINFALNGLSYARAAGNTSEVSMTVVTSDGILVDSDTVAIGLATVINLTGGADTYTSPAGNYIINAFGGADTITTGAGNNTVNAGDGANTITMGAGNSTVTTTGSSANTITTAASPGGTHFITTGSGDDIFTIGATTSAGNITINAGEGNNIFVLGTGNSFLTGGSGVDTITTGVGNAVINAGDGANVITTGVGNSTITAGSGADNITAGATAGGVTTINAGDGANIVVAGIGKYAITTGSGIDTITIAAGAGDVTINAGSGNDIITSGAGNDLITGGAGNDTMTGGMGADVFKWSLGETGSDVITDFNLTSVAAGGDALDLKDLLTSEVANATSLSAYLTFSAASATGTLITVDTNGTAAGGAGQTITLENVTFASLQTHAGGTSDIAIITKLLADGNLITSP